MPEHFQSAEPILQKGGAKIVRQPVLEMGTTEALQCSNTWRFETCFAFEQNPGLFKSLSKVSNNAVE